MPKAGPKIATTCEVCTVAFERTPAFHRSAEAKGGKVRFCSQACFGVAKSSGLVQVVGKGKVQFTCEQCHAGFERWPSFVKWATQRGRPIRFCSNACLGKAKTSRLVLLPAHPAESARNKSDANRASWGLPAHSDEMMALAKNVRSRLARGIGFNASQLKRWLGKECARCGATGRLQLDHIICMAAGGKSEQSNAQTLCEPCNKWKRKHVDKPLVRQQFQSGGEG